MAVEETTASNYPSNFSNGLAPLITCGSTQEFVL